MTTYYINPDVDVSGNGLTIETPFKSFTDLPAIAAGDTIELQPGTVIQLTATYAFPSSGTTTAPIVLRTNPNVPGEKAIIRVPNKSTTGLQIVSRSYIRIENILVEGIESDTNKTAAAINVLGGGNVITLIDVDTRWVGNGFGFDAGFARTGIYLYNCTARYCGNDGLRWWSSSNANTWSDFVVVGGDYSHNGTNGTANGGGVMFYVYVSTHLTQILRNVTVQNITASSNRRSGIALDTTQFSLMTSASYAGPPSRNYQGVYIGNNICTDNGDAGIIVNCAAASTTMNVLIENNYLFGNSQTETRGGIWTAGSTNITIQKNVISDTYTNGTLVGDGEGIFDDQWNDGCVVRWNKILNGIYRPEIGNPDGSAYGIGIYRTTNSLHYGNLIKNCRYGYIIGTVPNAVAPLMDNTRVFNNTIIDSTVDDFAIWFETPSNKVTIRNNLLINSGARPAGAGGAVAGLQTYSNNYAFNSTNPTDGANIPDGGFIFRTGVPVDRDLELTDPFLAGIGDSIDIKDYKERDFKRKPAIGAFEFHKRKTRNRTGGL